MNSLTANEKRELTQLIESGATVPERWRHRLFPERGRTSDTGKEYRLVYDGKLKREEVLAQTPAAPWQLVREFCAKRPHGDGWRNLLVWGDNLLALRELLADQQGPDCFGTRGKIKLIYIDPPFATRQDFMRDKEKAYRDKVIGAQFIEFLRRRLIILRELLADDGSIYVHLDIKKGHYIKAVLDEVFGEEKFQNEIVLQRTTSRKGVNQLGRVHDLIYFYTKGDRAIWHPPAIPQNRSNVRGHDLMTDSDGRVYRLSDLSGAGPGPARLFNGKSIRPPSGRHWGYDQPGIDDLMRRGRIAFSDKGRPRLKTPLDELEGVAIHDVWTDITALNSAAAERISYPTQKPEALLERIIRASSNEGDVVLDCFVGSGTTAAVAEKLGRRWVAMDCGKLAIYTTQQRLFSLTTSIGTARKDDRAEPERAEDWGEHLKSSPGVLLITEKARKGECEVTLDLLHDLSALARKHSLLKKGAGLSIVCPQDKLCIAEEHLSATDGGPGKCITIDGVEFRLSVIAPVKTPAPDQPLPVKQFALVRAGVYDMAAIKALPWADYRPFVLKLFGVRQHAHARYGVKLDGYISTHSALVWNYPDHRTFTLDYGYVDDLHRTLRGKPGERFYVIAPVVAMSFAEDEVMRGETTYIFLKVPISVLLRLIESGEPAAFKQPSREEDVNEVIDAVGFDFISQPKVAWKAKIQRGPGDLFPDYVLEISEFRAQTLATDPEDFKNFETFSMAMVDLDYDGDVFRLTQVFWGDDVIKAAGGLEKAERLELRIGEAGFRGRQMMVILCDRYGNEKALVLQKKDFEGQIDGAVKTRTKVRRRAK